MERHGETMNREFYKWLKILYDKSPMDDDSTDALGKLAYMEKEMGEQIAMLKSQNEAYLLKVQAQQKYIVMLEDKLTNAL